MGDYNSLMESFHILRMYFDVQEKKIADYKAREEKNLQDIQTLKTDKDLLLQRLNKLEDENKVFVILAGGLCIASTYTCIFESTCLIDGCCILPLTVVLSCLYFVHSVAVIAHGSGYSVESVRAYFEEELGVYNVVEHC